MDFLKRHYEKVILVGLFVLFIGLMFFVQSIVGSTSQVTEKDLKLPEPKVDYQNKDPKDETFNADKRWNDTKLVWDPNNSREKGKVYSDFVSVFPMALCPYCKESREKEKGMEYSMLIPLADFSVKTGNGVTKGFCPECGHELPPPPEKSAAELASTEADRDGDGIPNEVESKFGMNPDDPNDARYDSDGDGFSNAFEIANDTAPNDATKHPPLWWRLYIKDIRKVELPVKFMALSDNGSKDKEMWSLQFNHPDPRRPGRITSTFLRKGRSIKIEGRTYVVTDVERRFEQRKRQGGALVGGEGKEVTESVDVSRVYLTEKPRDPKATPDKLVMVVNQPAYSSDKRPVLCDSGDTTEPRPEYVLKIGDTISLGLFNVEGNETADNMGGGKRPRRVILARYKLKEVDSEKMILRFEDVTLAGRRGADNRKPEIIELTREGKIPVKMFPIKKKVEKVAEPQPENLGAGI